MKKNPPIIKKVVLEMGGSFEDVSLERGCFYIFLNGKKILIERKISISRAPYVSGRITKYKDLTSKILLEKELPTPKTICVYKKNYNQEATRKLLEGLNMPIIIKDAQGSNSKGIFPGIGNVNEAMDVLAREMDNYPNLIAQEMVKGREYRVLVLDDKVIGALEMIPPRVIGDGKATIKDLILQKQKFTEKKTSFGGELELLLAKQGFSLQDRLPKNMSIFIKEHASLAEGGEMNDVTDIVHGDIAKICSEAGEAVGKFLVGIDVMCDDIALPVSSQSFNIIEINGKPDLYIHYMPTSGAVRNVVSDILNFMVKRFN